MSGTCWAIICRSMASEMTTDTRPKLGPPRDELHNIFSFVCRRLYEKKGLDPRKIVGAGLSLWVFMQVSNPAFRKYPCLSQGDLVNILGSPDVGLGLCSLRGSKPLQAPPK